MNRNLVLIVILLALLNTACATKVPLTQQLRKDYNLTSEVLGDIQYYSAGKITLSRETTDKDVQVSKNSRLKLLNNKVIEEIVIFPGTPGSAKIIDEDMFLVSFEEGDSFDQGKYLGFTVHEFDSEGRYMLKEDDMHEGVGKVKYENKMFDLKGDYATFYLMVDLDEIKKYDKNTRVLKGRRVPVNQGNSDSQKTVE